MRHNRFSMRAFICFCNEYLTTLVHQGRWITFSSQCVCVRVCVCRTRSYFQVSSSSVMAAALLSNCLSNVLSLICNEKEMAKKRKIQVHESTDKFHYNIKKNRRDNYSFLLFMEGAIRHGEGRKKNSVRSSPSSFNRTISYRVRFLISKKKKAI